MPLLVFCGCDDRGDFAVVVAVTVVVKQDITGN